MKRISPPQWMKDIETWVSLGLLTVISVLTHLPLIGQLGYYRNDWYPIWAGRTQTLSTMVSMFSIDRPILGYIYTRTYLLLGDNPLNWQVFAYLFRLAGIIGVFWLLRLIWPKMRLFTTSATILFVVYPGFLEGPAAITFSNHLIAYALAIYSILFTVISIRSHNKYVAILATGLALLCLIGYPFIYEYMIGLEGLRLILVWYLTAETVKPLKAKLAKVFLRWAAYLPILAGFLYWRVFVFKSARPTTDVLRLLGLYTSSTFAMTQKVVLGALKDFLNATFFAWVVPPYQLITITRNRDLLVGLILAVLASGLFWMYFQWTKKKGATVTEETGVFRSIAGIGLVTVFCAIIPVAVSNRHISFSTWLDRYTLHTTVGVVLLVTGGIFLMIKNQGRLWLLLSLLFLSVLTHYSNQASFRNAWEIQKQLWWQLSWRAPQLEDGTVLMVNLPSDIYGYEEDYEVWMPANIIYNDVPNTVRIYSEVLYPGSVIQVFRGATEHRFIRNIEFDRDYNHALIISMPGASSCVHVIDGERPELSLNEPPIVDWVAPYSHIQQIETDITPSQPPEIIFGKEPPHTWCYSYQKMTLARQRGAWDQVIALGNEAINAGFKPLDQSEWMPLIEGYAYSGDFEKANSIIVKIYDVSNLRYNLCISVLKQKENPGLNLPAVGVDFLLDRLCGIQ